MQVRMNTFFLQSFRGLRGIKKQVVNLGTANLRSKTVGVDTVVEGGSVGVAGGGGGGPPAKGRFFTAFPKKTCYSAF